MNRPRLICALCAVLFTLLTASANARLEGRLPLTPGGTDYQAAYDTALDITWTTDAALSGVNSWDSQVAWADSLNYLGFDDWRLASMSVAGRLPPGTAASVVDCSTTSEEDCRDNELGYMFYQNLGGMSGDDLTGNPVVDAVDLMNVQSSYWSDTEFVSDLVWGFSFNGGGQDLDPKFSLNYGWAVRVGDVAAEPEPPMLRPTQE